MRLFVDADACPVVIREMLYRAAERCQIECIFIANQLLRLPPSPYLKALQVSQGFDEADNEIVRRCQAGDLVITSDLPLALDALNKGALALTTRGVALTIDNIKAKVTMRDFMECMRSSGVQTQGPAALSAKDKQQFANQLNRYLNKQALLS